MRLRHIWQFHDRRINSIALLILSGNAVPVMQHIFNHFLQLTQTVKLAYPFVIVIFITSAALLSNGGIIIFPLLCSFIIKLNAIFFRSTKLTGDTIKTLSHIGNLLVYPSGKISVLTCHNIIRYDTTANFIGNKYYQFSVFLAASVILQFHI